MFTIDPLQIPIGFPGVDQAVAAAGTVVAEVVMHGRDLLSLSIHNTGANPLTSFILQEKYFKDDEWGDFLGETDFADPTNPNLEYAVGSAPPHTLIATGKTKFKVWHSGAYAVRAVAKSTLGTTLRAAGNVTKS